MPRGSPLSRREPGYVPPPELEIHIVSLDELIGGSRPSTAAGNQMDLFGGDDSGGDDSRGMHLWCAGDLSLMRHGRVAVVGTRTPTSGGVTRARRLARELGQAGVVVVSGLARGVDTEALAAALKSRGRVIGVIGTPLDKAYPAENKRLQERIYGEHLLISQFPPGQRVHQGNFPTRNRLMAALSDATAIIEAGDNSGTLHQAAECVRLGRRLFIARSIVEDPDLKWPAAFLGQRHVSVLTSTDDILKIFGAPC